MSDAIRGRIKEEYTRSGRGGGVDARGGLRVLGGGDVVAEQRLQLLLTLDPHVLERVRPERAPTAPIRAQTYREDERWEEKMEGEGGDKGRGTGRVGGGGELEAELGDDGGVVGEDRFALLKEQLRK